MLDSKIRMTILILIKLFIVILIKVLKIIFLLFHDYVTHKKHKMSLLILQSLILHHHPINF